MKLNRKAMVLAVGAALAAPGAYAQVTSKAGSEWEFYGKFYPEMDRVTGASPTPATGTTISTLASITNGGRSNLVNRTEMLVGNSYVGFRGSKSIGSGMKAIWQVETVVSIDEGAAGSGLGTRNTFLGVQGGWGTVRLGFMDTPFKEAGDVVGFLGVSSGNFVQTNPLLRNVGFGQGNGGVNSNASRFHERRGNAIDFASPTYFGGLQYAAQYSLGSQANPSEASKTSGGGAGSGTIPRDPWVMSQAVKWEAGPWYFAVMHEVHYDFFGGSINSPDALKNDSQPGVHSKDSQAQVTAMYKVGGHTFEVDFNKKLYKEDAAGSSSPNGRFESYKNSAWMAAWEARWSSQWRTAVTFVGASAGTCTRFNATCDTTGLEGAQISLGGSYYIDPSTYLFLIGSVMGNGASARYDNVSNGSPATGEDVLQIAFGIAHNF
jgi:predicted porin